MSLCSTSQMDEPDNEKASSSSKLPVNVECCMELRDDGDEDEDVDFNPCWKEKLSPDASSSLSSEIEERDVGGDVTDSSVGYFHNGDDETAPQDFEIAGDQASNHQENVASVSQSEIESMRDHDMGLTSEADFSDYRTAEELGTKEDVRNPVLDFDDNEDAICKRTRARYSLASFTLDELETFLQETDDDDDPPNVDDEEEYKKFLAAVLLEGDDDRKNDHENLAVDDEDEENDADFELEIEEALESDIDDRINSKGNNEAGRRPQTRQNKHKKASSVKDSGNLQNVQRPLRPLVPIMPNAPISLLSAIDRAPVQPCLSSSLQNVVASGFTPHQLGQLHCIIYEHIQLLVQVFSLSVFDPSRQHIASQAEGHIMDLIDRRNQALDQRSEPHPYSCFSASYVHPSVPCELSKTWPIQFSSVQPQPPSQDSFGHPIPSHSSIVPCADERLHNEDQEDNSQKKERVFWLPEIRGPLYTILDATPLRLVGDYIHNVKIAMRDYQQRYLRDTCDTQFERESMFPSFLDPTVGHADPKTIRVSSSDGLSSVSSSQSSRKSFAAELIENSKKQPIALVPRVVSKLAQRFYGMFNPALYPRKPPPVVIANRVLFTSTEDELLALGMMEYNTDWKAIQQRFLPCKSKHQIFVRQKNCCSSKAPDNPIKAVRRMKTSPLTVDEVARIREGLRFFKLDWFSIWKFIVPYRDPSLLARQWRIALGTQKSYKTDSVNRERRRQYEANRRRTKAELAESQTLSQKRDNHDSADDSTENEDEAFFHEAFLADWRPGASSIVSSQPQYRDIRGKNIYVRSGVQAYHLNQSGTKLPDNCQGNVENGPDAEKGSYNSNPDAMMVKYPISGATLNPSKSSFCSRPYRARRSRRTQMVKLAPDLPAVNLPPSVRVISQSAFKNYHSVAAVKVPASGSGGAQNPIPAHLSFPGAGASFSNMGSGLARTNVTNSKEDDDGANLEMHPLLFQSSGNESALPYHLVKFSSGNSCSFSFFNGSQPQASRSLFDKEQDVTVGSLYNNLIPTETTLAPCSIDFHPLLKRADDAECSTGIELLPVQPSTTSEHAMQIAVGNHSSLRENANELNMEIQPSSSSKDQQLGMSNDGTDNKRPTFESIITSKGTRNLPTSPAGNDPIATSFLASSANALTYRLDLAGEQSLDIVMEQEELSDSDEEDNEIEDVEFECEEMTDSEPDVESDFNAAVEAQNKATVQSNKEVLCSDGNKLTVSEPGSKEQDLEDGSHFHPCMTINGAGQNRDCQKCDKDKLTDNLLPFQPIRPSKKRTPIRKRSRVTVINPSSEQLRLSTSIEMHPKKLRKRVCRSKLNLNATAAAASCSDSVNIDKQF